tara:strand:- start:41636 stop:41839 length:204 start_codon:yes stop_codon:yes gene_type:complete
MMLTGKYESFSLAYLFPTPAVSNLLILRRFAQWYEQISVKEQSRTELAVAIARFPLSQRHIAALKRL